MTNLLEETRAAVLESGHELSDIRFIGSSDGEYRTDWDGFASIADVEYDSGYGSAEVATDLIIVFTDGRKMWRDEYDGSEWWAYDSPLNIDFEDPDAKPLISAVGSLWPSVSVLHSTDPTDEAYQRKTSDD